MCVMDKTVHITYLYIITNLVPRTSVFLVGSDQIHNALGKTNKQTNKQKNWNQEIRFSANAIACK